MGARLQRVGRTAKSILLGAESLTSGRELFLTKPNIPEYSNYVIFDLEGLPPQMDELEKIYLWGMQVFGDRQSEYLAATAGFDSKGDKAGWFKFLELSRGIFDEYEDLPFVHWHHYEKTNVKKYIDRYGDLNGIAQRVLDNLLDLHPITKNSIILPLPSYSLKVVEQYVGYTRTLEEFGGDWAMAKYIEATETKDENLRNDLFDKILAYNREDLEATWAVLTWLKQKM